jgi:hypothetical protein
MKAETAARSERAWLPGRAAPATGQREAPGDNVTPRPAIRPKGASQPCPGETTCKVTINSVSSSRRKDSWHYPDWIVDAGAKRHTARWGYSILTPFSPVVRPEDSHSLKARGNVSHVELGKSVAPCTERSSSRAARYGDGAADKGGRRKRMPPCNGADRAAPARRGREYPPRKGADFRLVLTEGKLLGRHNSWRC